ncbi:hypothetical protein [Actinoplanes sp. HUAS TT8]|uniref:hypothetical protein n=1 Tax=Actinoplanes sp. HUAS TT8 TaxID=3447453 RepID=UPI003F51CED2
MPTPPSQPENEKPLPYEECTDAAYAEHASRFDVEQVGRSTVLRGICQRCRHVMEYLIRGHVVRTGGRWPFSRPQPELPATGTERMICTCDGDHPNRPDGFKGCGAFWDVTITAS